MIQAAPGCLIHSLVDVFPLGSVTLSFLISKKLPLYTFSEDILPTEINAKQLEGIQNLIQ